MGEKKKVLEFSPETKEFLEKLTHGLITNEEYDQDGWLFDCGRVAQTLVKDLETWAEMLDPEDYNVTEYSRPGMVIALIMAAALLNRDLQFHSDEGWTPWTNRQLGVFALGVVRMLEATKAESEAVSS